MFNYFLKFIKKKYGINKKDIARECLYKLYFFFNIIELLLICFNVLFSSFIEILISFSFMLAKSKKYLLSFGDLKLGNKIYKFIIVEIHQGIIPNITHQQFVPTEMLTINPIITVFIANKIPTFCDSILCWLITIDNSLYSELLSFILFSTFRIISRIVNIIIFPRNITTIGGGIS